MKKDVIVIVPRTSVQVTNYVRDHYDDERVKHFEEEIVYGNIGGIMPIDVYTYNGGVSYILHDGRHRFRAFERQNVTEIPVRVIPAPLNESAGIFSSFMANVGGPKPPTTDDLKVMIRQQVKLGTPMERIVNELRGHFSTKRIREVVRRVTKNIEECKAREAVAYRNKYDGVTFADAGRRFGISADAVRAMANRGKNSPGIASFQERVTKLHRSDGQQRSSIVSDMRNAYESGDVTSEEFFRILDRIRSQVGTVTSFVDDAENRFRANLNR